MADQPARILLFEALRQDEQIQTSWLLDCTRCFIADGLAVDGGLVVAGLRRLPEDTSDAVKMQVFDQAVSVLAAAKAAAEDSVGERRLRWLRRRVVELLQGYASLGSVVSDLLLMLEADELISGHADRRQWGRWAYARCQDNATEFSLFDHADPSVMLPAVDPVRRCDLLSRMIFSNRFSPGALAVRLRRWWECSDRSPAVLDASVEDGS